MPPSGACSPAIARRTVLLPEPEGPIRLTTWPSATSSATPVDHRLGVAVAHAKIAHPHDRRAPRAPRSSGRALVRARRLATGHAGHAGTTSVSRSVPRSSAGLSTPPVFSAVDHARQASTSIATDSRIERVAVAGDDLVEARAVAADEQLRRQRLADLGDRRGALRQSPRCSARGELPHLRQPLLALLGAVGDAHELVGAAEQPRRSRRCPWR